MTLLKELEEICSECLEPDWDLDGAKPLNKDLIEECRRFIEWLPLKLEAGVVPFSDGSIGIDFYSDDSIVSIVFQKENIAWCRSIGKIVESGTYSKCYRFLHYILLGEVLKIFQ